MIVKSNLISVSLLVWITKKMINYNDTCMRVPYACLTRRIKSSPDIETEILGRGRLSILGGTKVLKMTAMSKQEYHVVSRRPKAWTVLTIADNVIK